MDILGPHGRAPAANANGARSQSDVRHAGGASIERWYYAGLFSSSNLTVGNLVANTLYAMPFIAPRRGGALDRLGFNVTTLLAGNARTGLYENLSDDLLYPGALVAGSDSGSISTGTTGVKSLTPSPLIALRPGGIYWQVIVADAAVEIRCFTAADSSGMLGVSNALGTVMNKGMSVAFTYAALPAAFPGSAADFTGAPIPALAHRFGR